MVFLSKYCGRAWPSEHLNRVNNSPGDNEAIENDYIIVNEWIDFILKRRMEDEYGSVNMIPFIVWYGQYFYV